ncbi:hypothetical protein F8388_021628 [Cannabis sativa]|uniref:Uncharacterized protein n=1 Tax=Cannabis sativa TaxID=3483 RepID=A0A7J6G662_CANSA|nr:hypothetical protein F8388_019087 [Cannabis sativa]KAF4378434.1 hypothetical protein F8388_021628 [Cannabis sativa]KAF4386435.1 hypothetical protein G4B88_020255 [Cannabis sativa]
MMRMIMLLLFWLFLPQRAFDSTYAEGLALKAAVKWYLGYLVLFAVCVAQCPHLDNALVSYFFSVPDDEKDEWARLLIDGSL